MFWTTILLPFDSLRMSGRHGDLGLVMGFWEWPIALQCIVQISTFNNAKMRRKCVQRCQTSASWQGVPFCLFFFVKICQFMSFLCSSRCKHSCSNSQMAESLWKEIPMGSNESILGPGPLFNKWLSLVYRYGYRQRTSVKQRGNNGIHVCAMFLGSRFFLGTLSLYSAGCMLLLHDFLVPFFIAGLR